MKITISLYILFFFIGASGQAQNTFTTDSLKTIEQLSFMKGTWKGNGWMMINRERKKFTQNETISSRVDDKILVIDGIGHEDDSTQVTKKVIHNAFGVISYNEDKGLMTMLSISSTGGKMENELKLIGDKKLEWSFKDAKGGTIRFREDFSEEGIWLEVGDYSFDGEKWFPFFQMRLEKTNM
jgi:hypothetical protein